VTVTFLTWLYDVVKWVETAHKTTAWKRFRMRKLHLTLALTLLLQACAGVPFFGLPQPTSMPPATKTATITLTPSITPTASITPTIRPSATIVHIPTQDPNLPTATFAPIVIFIGSQTATPPPTAGLIPSATVFSPGTGFVSVEISESKIFWGSCKPNKSKVTAKVEDFKKVASVVIFVQVKSAVEEDYTPWTTGDIMFNNRDGTFTYTLQANEIEGHNHYRSSWVRFQLVAIDAAGKEIGRTMIFADSVALSPCM
jgi:hypothetical protein